MKKFLIYIFLLSFSLNLAANSPIRVVCIGNSITHGSGASDSLHAYPAQLGNLLGTGYTVFNGGVGSRTMLKKGDYPYWNEAKYVSAKNSNPDIVIISLGTNDSKSQNWAYGNEFYSDYVAMVNEFRAGGRNPRIFVCFPPPAFKDNYGIRNAVIRDQIIPLIDSVAKTQHTSLIDYNTPLLPFGKLFADAIHPNNQGALLLAKLACAAITGIPQPNIFKWDYTDEATISSTISNIGALTDNNESSELEINPQGTVSVNFDFPYKMYIDGCLFYSASNGLAATDWEIQYSNDKTSWTSSIATEGNPTNNGKVYTLITNPARYFRLLLKGSKALKINEFQLFGYPRINEKGSTAPYLKQYPDDLTGDIADNPLIGTYTAGDPGLTDYNEIAINAIDGLVNKYTVNGKLITINYSFKTPVKVGSYSLAVGSTSNIGRNPMSWKLYGAGADLQYTPIAEEKFFIFPYADYCNMKFQVPQPGEYLSYRIVIEGMASESTTHLSEWQLFSNQIFTDVQSPNVSSNSIQIYPNPSTGSFKIDTNGLEIKTIIVSDLTGKIAKAFDKCQSVYTINDLSKGMYTIQVISEGQKFNSKIILL